MAGRKLALGSFHSKRMVCASIISTFGASPSTSMSRGGPDGLSSRLLATSSHQ